MYAVSISSGQLDWDERIYVIEEPGGNHIYKTGIFV